jgi:hypothetical protein
MKNYVTGNTYTGQNATKLEAFSSEGFLTFMQAKSIGRSVAGADGIELMRVVKVKKTNKLTGKKEIKKVPKRFWVFRIEDTIEMEAA